MRPWPKFVLLAVIGSFAGMFSSPVMAKTAGYCQECHSQKFSRIVGAEGRSVYQAKLDPCPGVRALSEEIFFTESRIVGLNQALEAMEREGSAGETRKQKVFEAAESFTGLRKGAKNSIQQFSQDSAALRASLQKVYEGIVKDREESFRRRLIGLGALILLGVLVLLGIGYRKLKGMGKGILLFLLIGGSISLSSCSPGQGEPEKKSPAQERLDRALSVANRSLNRMEETFSLAILLAEVAGEWAKLDPAAADNAFQIAWQMALTAREQAGQAGALRGVISRWPDRAEALKEKVNFDAVLDLSDEIRSADSRAWALRAVAEEWVETHEKKGKAALEYTSREVLAIKDAEFRDRDLRSIAEAWGRIDKSRSLEIARHIGDPFLKSTALIEASFTGAHLEEAWQVAESIPASYLQIRAFLQISTAAARMNPAEKSRWAEKIWSRVKNLKNPELRSFTIQEAVSAWAPLDWKRAEHWAGEIPANFPTGRAYAFIHIVRRSSQIPQGKALGLLKNAIAEADKVADSYEAQKVRRLAILSLSELEPQEALRQIPGMQSPYYQSEILGELAGQVSRKDKIRALELAEKIPIKAFRLRNKTEIIGLWMPLQKEKIAATYREALQAALTISDPYDRCLILLDLGRDWQRWDRENGAAVLDLTLRKAGEITSPSMKAEVLRSLAEAWKNSDKNRARSILDGISPSVTAVGNKLEEIRLWAKTDPMKARQWAESLPSDFPLEKAGALQDVSAGLKKDHPRPAFDIIEKALALTQPLPEGSRRNRMLTHLVSEAALLDKERTIARVRAMQEREIRDLLFREVTNTLVREDPEGAMKAAMEISESAFRFPLYQKIAEGEAKFRAASRLERKKQPAWLALHYWGLGREKAKSNESQAASFYERALQEAGKVADLRNRAYLLCGLTAEWALIDEKKALTVAEKISPEFPEPFSYALLRVAAQLQRWTRAGAESVFEKTLATAIQIADPLLRAQRLLQLGREWEVLDKGKGREVLKKAESEARKSIHGTGRGEKILGEIIVARATAEPEQALVMARSIESPFLRAKIFLENGRVLGRSYLEPDVKVLSESLQFAQSSKNPQLLSEVAVAWFALDPQKGLELVAQVEPAEMRVKALRRMARQSAHRSKEEANRLLQQASREALGMDGLKQRMQTLKEIAGDWMGVDKERAKATYKTAYGLVEKEYFF